MIVGRDFALHPRRAGRHQAGDPCPRGCSDANGPVPITALSGNPGDKAEYAELWCPQCRSSYGRE